MRDILTYPLLAAMFVVGMYYFYSALERREALFATINQERVR